MKDGPSHYFLFSVQSHWPTSPCPWQKQLQEVGKPQPVRHPQGTHHHHNAGFEAFLWEKTFPIKLCFAGNLFCRVLLLVCVALSGFPDGRLCHYLYNASSFCARLGHRRDGFASISGFTPALLLISQERPPLPILSCTRSWRKEDLSHTKLSSSGCWYQSIRWLLELEHNLNRLNHCRVVWSCLVLFCSLRTSSSTLWRSATRRSYSRSWRWWRWPSGLGILSWSWPSCSQSSSTCFHSFFSESSLVRTSLFFVLYSLFFVLYSLVWTEKMISFIFQTRSSSSLWILFGRQQSSRGSLACPFTSSSSLEGAFLLPLIRSYSEIRFQETCFSFSVNQKQKLDLKTTLLNPISQNRSDSFIASVIHRLCAVGRSQFMKYSDNRYQASNTLGLSPGAGNLQNISRVNLV